MENLTYLIIWSALVPGFWAISTIVIRTIRNPLSSLPGPWVSKWTDLVLKYYWLNGRKPEYCLRLHQKYGPVVRVAPDEVDISDVGAAKEIHRVGGPFLKSKWYLTLIAGGVHNIFSITDLEKHSWHRRLLSAPLAEKNVKLMEPIINARISLAIGRISQEIKTRGAADVFKWWTFMTTDIIGELSFGNSFRMLEQGKTNQYIDDLHSVAFFGAIRSAFPTLLKAASSLPLPLFRKLVIADDSVQRYKRQVLAEPNNVKPTLFTHLYRAGDEGMSDVEIKSEAQAYIIAGSDTTSSTLTYLVWAVCRDQQIKHKLTAELRTLPEDFLDQDIKNLPYLNQVITETLRLYAAAPSSLPRVVPQSGAKLAGHCIPGGFTVSTQAYSLHRDPIVYTDPEKFDPSRWERPTKEMRDAFMPYGGGTRICIGMHLAYMELRRSTAMFFRAFPEAMVSKLENMSDEDMEAKIYFLMTPKGRRCLIQAS